MLQLIQQGGLLLWPLVILSVISLGIFLERWFYFHRIIISVDDLMHGIGNLVRKNSLAEAMHECASLPGPVPRVLRAAIAHHHLQRDELKEIVQESGQMEVPKLERRLSTLAALANLAPLLGLLGTVIALLGSFQSMTESAGFIRSDDILRGVYQSLYLTAAGLIVAIISRVFYHMLNCRVEALIQDIERGGIEILHIMGERQTAARIISFEQATKEHRRSQSG